MALSNIELLNRPACGEPYGKCISLLLLCNKIQSSEAHPSKLQDSGYVIWACSLLCRGLCSCVKARASHSSTRAWKIPCAEEPGGLQSMGSLRVGHDWTSSFSLFTCMHWRRKWQLTPAFLPGESQGRRSLMGCRLRGRTESNTTEAT